MDYEKKYKEALEIARKINSGEGVAAPSDWSVCETIFPELKESEDERIRKEILLYFTSQDIAHQYVNDKRRNRWIAWLEKQDKQNPITDFSNLRTWKYIVDAVLTEKEGIGQHLDSPFTEEVAKKLQKRFGNIEQKSKDSYVFNSIPRLLELIEPIPLNEANSYCQKLIDSLQQEGYVIDAEIVGECLKQMNGEQAAMATMDEKTAEEHEPDKVEPRFHEGEWVACNSDVHLRSPLRVVSVRDTEYKIEDSQGVPGSQKIEHLDWHYHLWAINDAKDGDVLAGEYDDYKKPWVGIFKCISENRPQRQFDSYCFIISSRHGFITPDSCDFYNFCKGHTIRYTKPATKKQRDMLFQKMHEAGYEWDAKRKELKELSKSDETSDQEQKPAWSAEDEERYLSCLKRLGTGDIRQPETINTVWLKSVKNRIQPKQEWSEEDEAMYQGIIETEQYMLDVVYGRKIFAVGNEGIKEECTKELFWLKSLKDRIK